MCAEATVPHRSADGQPNDRLGQMFAAHAQRLYVLARRLSSNADDARDMVQETFVRAAGALDAVPPHAEEAWLVRVLVNQARDRWKQKATRARLFAVHGRSEGPPRDPESAFVARAIVWQAVTTLAPRRRAVVVLHELEGASVPEIAQLLGIRQVTVRWHLSRGRHDIREFLMRTGAGT
jgi:RNA polymerase sigma-70 factor (ECF subfamily)